MIFATRYLLFCDTCVMCACTMRGQGRGCCWQHGHEAMAWTMRSGGRVAHAGASHAYPDPRGHRYLGCGFTRRKHTHFSRRGGAIGTPFRGGKYIFFNFLYGVDFILDCQILFHGICESCGAGMIYMRIFKMITLKTYRI